MKKILFFKKNIKQRALTHICCLVILSALLHLSCADVYDKVKEFSPEEVIYPGHFDTIYGRVGYERVEIDLSKAGRIPSNQMNLGKAKKTIVEYGTEVLTFDSVCSWISIKGLTLPNIYRFKIYTANEEGDRSTPLEIALTPYTAPDLATLSLSTPDVIQSTTSALLEWKSRLSSDLYDVYGYSYKYVDRNGDTIRGSSDSDVASFFVEDVLRNVPVLVDVTLKMIPKVARIPILDTLYKTFTTTIIVNGTKPVIFLDKPELGAAFNNGFHSGEPIEFSWVRVEEATDYLLKISDSQNFPDGDRTFIVPVGNTDSYTLTGAEQLAIFTLSNNSSVLRPILFWTVVPASADLNITTQTRQITGRKVIKLAPTGTVVQMTVTKSDGDVYKFVTNGDDPSVYTPAIRIINPGASDAAGKLTLSWAYKSTDDCRWEIFFCKPNVAAGIATDYWAPRSDEWQEAILDIGQYMREFSWGTAATHRLRIDPGGSRIVDGEGAVPTQRTVYMTNMQINIY